MPKDNIERAIQKGTGEGGETDAFENVIYEGYGPGGVALLVEALTDNRNRTGADVRHLLQERREPWRARIGRLPVRQAGRDRGRLLAVLRRRTDVAIEAGAEDIELDERRLRGDHRARRLHAGPRGARGGGVEMQSAEMAYRPSSLEPLDEAPRSETDAPDRGPRGQRRRRGGSRQLRRGGRRARTCRRLRAPRARPS